MNLSYNFKPNTIVVDDEVHAAQLMKMLLEPFPIFGQIVVFTNAADAFTKIIEHKPAYLFLDIEMPGISGIQLAERIITHSPDTRIIYVTAFEHYALDALRQNAFDYMLKPVMKTDLIRVVDKLIFSKTKSLSNHKSDKLLIRSTEGIYHVTIDEMVYLEADCSYTTIILKSGDRILSSLHMGKILTQLPAKRFIRISRKHLINKSYITFYHSKEKFVLLKTLTAEYQLKVMLKVHEIKELLIDV